MRIINTSQKSKLAKFLLLTFNAFLLIIILSGCNDDSKIGRAKNYIKRSEAYYGRAEEIYHDLIKKGKNSDQLHFELGMLYYQRGDFEEAVKEFRISLLPEAEKYLASALYKTGDFTDALELFEKGNFSGAEFLYYYGLTCEGLNLFDKALDTYARIDKKEFKAAANQRMNAIEKQSKGFSIADINPQAQRLITESPGEKEYPQAGALILSCDEQIEITADNKEITTLYYLIKILNQRGKESFSETQIEYDSTFEKIELEYARTIKPDGSIVDVGSRHIRDVSKYLNFPLYSNVRVYIISFPEISNGSFIEYKLKIRRNQLINKKDFSLSYSLQESEPVLNAKLKVILPQDKPLQIKTINEEYNNFNADISPKITQENGRKVYFWEFKDIPQIIPEANMPPFSEAVTTMLFSTFGDWKEIYQWWHQLSRDKIKADEAIKEKVRELTEDKVDSEEKIRAIYNFCAKDIRYVAVEYGQAGYEPHKAEDIFKNKYGDCKDQAVLLVTMLREAGLSGYLVLIPTSEYYNLNDDFPAVFFNHCIAATKIDERVIFLDPTAQTCSFGNLPPGDQDRLAMLFKEDDFSLVRTPLYLPSHNSIKQELNLKLNSDESITAKKNIFVSGVFEQGQRFWLLYTPPQLIEESLKEKIQDVSIGAKLNSYNVENQDNLNQPVVLTYSFSGPEYLTLAGNLRIMPQLAAVDAAIVAKESRVYPLDFSFPSQRELVFNFDLPDGFVVKYMPEKISEVNRWIDFSAQYFREENRLIFKQKVALKEHKVLQQDYLLFKSFFEHLARRIKERVILEKLK